MGRSGVWMAHHLLAPGVVPDVVTLAKGLGGGIPIGAVVATGEAASLLEPGQHGTTFGGNPVACAAALAVIDTIRSQDLLAQVERLGSAWAQELAAIDGVDQVRGRGLLIGVGLAEGLPPAGEIVAALAERGFIVNAPRPLKKLKNLSEMFSRAYDLRTKFFSIFEIKDVTIFSYELKNLIGELRESGIKECIKLGETLSNWEEEINNIQKYNINNGFVEGKNNKIKVIKRLSYGIKKFDNLKKLIKLRIS